MILILQISIQVTGKSEHLLPEIPVTCFINAEAIIFFQQGPSRIWDSHLVYHLQPQDASDMCTEPLQPPLIAGCFSFAGLFPHELNIKPASRTKPKTKRFLFIVLKIKIVNTKRLTEIKRLLQMRLITHLQYRRTGDISDTENTNVGEVHISGHQYPRGTYICIKRN